MRPSCQAEIHLGSKATEPPKSSSEVAVNDVRNLLCRVETAHIINQTTKTKDTWGFRELRDTRIPAVT